MKNSRHSYTLEETRANLKKDVDALKKDISSLTFDAREHATAHVDAAKQRVTDTIHSAQDSITTHPFMILSLGLVAGFLLGIRFSR